MKLKCNCCQNSEPIETGIAEPDKKIYCNCGKILAYSRSFLNQQYEWIVMDIVYDSDSDFHPVEIIE